MPELCSGTGSVSNSHAETVNKTIRNYYLNQLKIAGTDCLTKHFADILLNYNNIRPHGRIQGLTPLEAFTGITINHEANPVLKKGLCFVVIFYL